MSKYRKFIVAVVLAGIVAAKPVAELAFADEKISGPEWYSIILAIITAGLVYAVRNGDTPPPR